MKRRLLLLVACLGAAVVVAAAWYVRVRPYRDPAAALQQFLRFDARRDQQIIDPLVLCGAPVVPLVIAGLENRTLEGRPWAAAFLGDGGYQEAAPVLADLAQDEGEDSATRRHALQALASLQPNQAETIARTLAADPELGGSALAIVNGNYTGGFHRSYVEALFDFGD